MNVRLFWQAKGGAVERVEQFPYNLCNAAAV